MNPVTKTLHTPQQGIFVCSIFSAVYLRYFTDFYRTLGWTPRHRKEPYCLLGTILACDTNTPLQAIIEYTKRRVSYLTYRKKPCKIPPNLLKYLS